MLQPQTGKSGEISSVNQHEILILYFSFFHPKNAVERLQPCPLNKRKKLDLGLDRKKSNGFVAFSHSVPNKYPVNYCQIYIYVRRHFN